MTTIKDASGRVIGQTKPYCGREAMLSPAGRHLGTYDTRTNRTYDAAGRVLTQGNTLTRLLPK